MLTPVLFFLVSSREMVKEAARPGELRTSLRGSRHSPRNLGEEDRKLTPVDPPLTKEQFQVFQSSSSVLLHLFLPIFSWSLTTQWSSAAESRGIPFRSHSKPSNTQTGRSQINTDVWRRTQKRGETNSFSKSPTSFHTGLGLFLMTLVFFFDPERKKRKNTFWCKILTFVREERFNKALPWFLEAVIIAVIRLLLS